MSTPPAPTDEEMACEHIFGRTPGRRFLACLECGEPYKEDAAPSAGKSEPQTPWEGER